MSCHPPENVEIMRQLHQWELACLIGVKVSPSEPPEVRYHEEPREFSLVKAREVVEKLA